MVVVTFADPNRPKSSQIVPIYFSEHVTTMPGCGGMYARTCTAGHHQTRRFHASYYTTTRCTPCRHHRDMNHTSFWWDRVNIMFGHRQAYNTGTYTKNERYLLHSTVCHFTSRRPRFFIHRPRERCKMAGCSVHQMAVSGHHAYS